VKGARALSKSPKKVFFINDKKKPIQLFFIYSLKILNFCYINRII
jgi:hypothetical protein